MKTQGPILTVTRNEFEILLLALLPTLTAQNPRLPSPSELTDLVVKTHQRADARPLWPAFRRLACQLPTLTQAQIIGLCQIIHKFRNGLRSSRGTIHLPPSFFFRVSRTKSLPHDASLMSW